jgi:predicted nucleic acid-binding protein
MRCHSRVEVGSSRGAQRPRGGAWTWAGVADQRIVLAESGNAIATRVRRGDLDRVRGNEALRDLQDVRLRTRPLDSAAVISALAVAHDLAHPVYDCCYLAMAIEEDAIAVTADRRFRSAVAVHPSVADRVVLLRDVVLR